MGSNATIKLADSGRYKIFVVHRDKSDVNKISVRTKQNINFVNLGDPTSIEKCFSENEIESIIHTATNYGRNGESQDLVKEANLSLPIRILELAIENKVPHFLNIDTSLNKRNNLYPHLSDYTETKREFTSILMSRSNQIQVSNLIVEYMFGPGDGENKFVTLLIRSAISEFNHKISLTPGEQKRDFVYIDDVVLAIECVLNSFKTEKYKFKSFEVGYGESISLVRFAEEVLKVLGSTARPPFGSISYRPDEIMDSKANIESLLRLGWKPTNTLEEGILKTTLYYLRQEKVESDLDQSSLSL